MSLVPSSASVPSPWGLSVASAKQRVILGQLLSAHTHLAGLQRLQGLEGDAKALGAHGGGPGLQVLIPAGWGVAW